MGKKTLRRIFLCMSFTLFWASPWLMAEKGMLSEKYLLRDAQRIATQRTNEISQRLSQCRSSCLSSCRNAPTRENAPPRDCSEARCDAGPCQDQKAQFDKLQSASSEEGDVAKARSLEEAKADLKEQEQKNRAEAERKKGLLDQCRTRCINTCRQNDGENCTNESCDAGECQNQAGHYNYLSRQVKNAETGQAMLDEDDGEEASGGDAEGALRQVRDKAKDMTIYAAIGGAGTAALSALAYFECGSCATGCWRCPVAVAAAALAAYQTVSMIKKAGKLGDVGTIMGDKCENPPCDGPSTPEELEPPPACEGPHCSVAVGPGQPQTPYNPDDNGDDPDPGDFDIPSGHDTTKLTGGPRINVCNVSMDCSRLRDGFPKDFPLDEPIPLDPEERAKSPWGKYKPTPAMKRQQKKLLAKVNKDNKALLDQLSTGNPFDENGELKEDLAGLGGKAPTSAFSGGSVASPARPLASQDTGGGKPKKKNPLAEQMKKMLNKMYGDGGTGKKALADKSIQVGSDIVGVAEDNIFMMVHRRHRSLDGEKRFIKEEF